MISLDTNLLFPALEPSHRDHLAAKRWLTALDSEVAISELVLMELYLLVRNPAIAARPLGSRRCGRIRVGACSMHQTESWR